MIETRLIHIGCGNGSTRFWKCSGLYRGCRLLSEHPAPGKGQKGGFAGTGRSDNRVKLPLLEFDIGIFKQGLILIFIPIANILKL